MVDLHKMIYNSGDFFMPQPVKKVLDTLLYKSYSYSFYIEIWHIVHLVTGFLLGIGYIYLGYNKKSYYLNLFIIHLIWEYWQVFIGMSHPLRLSYHNNLIDILVDTIIFMIGSYIAFTLVTRI